MAWKNMAFKFPELATFGHDIDAAVNIAIKVQWITKEEYTK